MPKWSDWNIAYTKKGKAHILRTRAMRLLAVGLAVVGLYRARQSGLSVSDSRTMIRNALREAFAKVIQVGTSLKSHAVAAVKP